MRTQARNHDPEPDEMEKHDNVIDWNLIETHWQDLFQVVISIQEGKVLPSMLLRKLGTSSHKSGIL
jgi:TnpA family transposase